VIEVRRGAGEVVLRVRGDAEIVVPRLTPAAARLLARRLTDAARDVESQVPSRGDGWELQEIA
jgi:hypothetical protein